jgi:hypothetical protein
MTTLRVRLVRMAGKSISGTRSSFDVHKSRPKFRKIPGRFPIQGSIAKDEPAGVSFKMTERGLPRLKKIVDSHNVNRS